MFSVFALIVAVVAAFVPAKNFARSPSPAVIKSSPVNIDFAALDDALDAPEAIPTDPELRAARNCGNPYVLHVGVACHTCAAQSRLLYGMSRRHQVPGQRPLKAY